MGLASGFGTGPGVPPSLSPPTQPQDTSPETITPTHSSGGGVLRQTLHSRHKHTHILRHFLPRHSINASTHIQYVFVCRPISTSHLHALQRFQIWPINPIISRGPQQKPHLKTGFPLRCFQRLSLPYVANQPCPRRNNWHTRGTSIPVLSY